jgi:ABC-type antimicrobial peptide transport system permease subunit
MSSVGFPLKGLVRRKFQTVLTVVALTFCVGSTVFLTLLGQILGFEIPLITEGRVTTGFSRIFSGFIIVTSFLNVLAGSLIVYFLVSNSMSQRTRDVGIMKAVGCLTQVAFGYFATELFIMVFTSCVAGAFLGALMVHSCIHFNILGVPTEQISINVWTIVAVFLVFVFTSHIFGILPVVRTIRIETAKALLPPYLRGESSKLGEFRLSKLGLSLKMAHRSLIRRKPTILRTIACLSAVLTLTTTMFIGGTIANDTTQNYLQRAIGENIVMISHSDIAEHYLEFLSPTCQTQETKSINYLDHKYQFSSGIVSKLSEAPGVFRVDPRLIFEETVNETQKTVIVDNIYLEIGDHRSCKALIMGVNPDNLLSDWLIFGRFFDKADTHSAIVGDSLASKILSDPTSQNIRLLEREFQVVGVCLDPINNGDVVYVPMQGLPPLLQQTSYNIVLFEIDPENRSEVVSAMEKEVLNTELQLVELNVALEEHKVFFNSLWSTLMFLPLFGLMVATICLASFMVLYVKEQQREFGVMRALGAKPRTIFKVIFVENLCITLTAGIIGILIGSVISFAFLIPEPIISSHSFLTVAGMLLLVLAVLCLSSLYPAYLVIKRNISEVLSPQ